MKCSMNLLNLIVTISVIQLCSSQENVVWDADGCPGQCMCKITERSATNQTVKWIKTTECIAKNLRELPEKIPRDTHALVLEENDLQDFDKLLQLLAKLPYIEEIVIADNKFKNFQSNYTLKSVSNVDASSNDLMEFSAKDFSCFPNLNQLSLQRNLISHIDQNLCSNNNSNLRSLDLSYNSIDNLDWIRNCLSLSFVNMLDVSGNKQRDRTVHNFSFTNLTFIEILRMEEMNLKGIEGDAFSGLVNLRTLDLDNNFFEQIPANALSKLKNLKSISLNGNRFVKIKARDVFNLAKLEIVELTNLPFLQIIDKFSFNNLPELKTLLLFDNPYLSYIDGKAFENCPTVKTLDLHNTLIATVLKITIDSLPSLRHIDLSDNQLNCNCMMAWAQKWAKNAEANENRKNMVCARPQKYRNSLLRDVTINNDGPCLPEIQPTFPIRLDAEENRLLVLDCRASGVPKPEISWILPGGRTLCTNSTNSNSNEVATLDSEGTLTVKNPEDATYKCIATNSNGYATREVQMTTLKNTRKAKSTYTTRNPLQETSSGPKEILLHSTRVKNLAVTTATASSQRLIMNITLASMTASNWIKTQGKKSMATTAATNQTMQQEKNENIEKPERNFEEPITGLEIQLLEVTATSALIAWSGSYLNNYHIDFQSENITLTLRHNGRIIYEKAVDPYQFSENIKFNFTTLHPASLYEICLSIKWLSPKMENSCTSIYTLPYTTKSASTTAVSVTIFLTLMGLMILTTAFACCGKLCSSSKKNSNYEKLESTHFEDIYQPLIQQTSENRKQEKLIKTDITTTFI